MEDNPRKFLVLQFGGLSEGKLPHKGKVIQTLTMEMVDSRV